MISDLRPDSVIKRPIFLPPRRPGYSIDFHPRAMNKPINCQVGLHHLPFKKILLDGIPHLYCIKCGQSMAEGLVTGTWSKDDINRLTLIKQKKYGNIGRRTPKQIVEDAIKRRQLEVNKKQRRENMERSIAQFVKERMLDE
jgi:hypothetical protein